MANEDKAKRIVRHIENVEFTASLCEIHPRKQCILLLNNYDHRRFHCLFANHSKVWKSYTISGSCDLPEHFYEMIQMHKQFGTEYVLPFSGCFREYSGYTVGMFYQPIQLYAPRKIQPHMLKEVAYALTVFFCAVCHQLGGNVPDLKQFLFLYTETHPVLCDMGSFNVDNRVRLKGHKPHFNEKKWRRFMMKKTLRDVIRYLKLEFKLFFQQKKKGSVCILDERENAFDTETHQLLCQSQKEPLVKILKTFAHLMPNRHIRQDVVETWTLSLLGDDAFTDDEMY